MRNAIKALTLAANLALGPPSEIGAPVRHAEVHVGIPRHVRSPSGGTSVGAIKYLNPLSPVQSEQASLGQVGGHVGKSAHLETNS